MARFSESETYGILGIVRIGVALPEHMLCCMLGTDSGFTIRSHEQSPRAMCQVISPENANDVLLP